MGFSLYSLEQSVCAGRKNSRAVSMSEGASPTYRDMQTQIAVVRGERVGLPTSGLLALEHRVLNGAATPAAVPVQRQVQRLDQGQLTRVPANPVAAQSWQPSQSFSAAPITSPADVSPYQQATSTYQLSPEFSAPDSARFTVESFSEPTNPDSLFKPDPALVVAPITAAPAPVLNRDEQPSQAVFAAPAPNNAIAGDGNEWMAGAQSSAPPKPIAQSSKRALNTEAALAKEDFERDLAAILGTSPAPTAPQEPIFDPARAPAPTPLNETSPVEQPAVQAHPNHSVFDQMGLGMTYANSFDLGKVSLSERLDQFERELNGATGKSASQAQSFAPAAATSFATPFVDAMNLDDFDLMAELAEISTERPASFAVSDSALTTDPLFNNGHNSPGENHEQ